MISNDNLPLDYREEEVGRVFSQIEAGESCSLIGVSSIGKSNFFRFILRSDVKAKYLGEIADKYLFVLLDSNFLTIEGVSEWKIYELMFHRLMGQAERLLVRDEVIKRFDDLYQRVITAKDPLLGLRYLERFLSFLCNDIDYKLVFLFDEFDEIIRNFDRRFFLNLRAFRDEFKNKIMYVVASRNELSLLREDISEIEAFYELLSMNVYGLKPYNDSDARFMIQRLARRRSISVDDTNIELLIKATGGHPGLLRAGFWFVSGGRLDKFDDLSEHLSKSAGVWEECLKIWDSLGKDEQEALSTNVPGNSIVQIPQEVFVLLEMKGLIARDKDNSTTIFCTIFKQFVDTQSESSGRGITIDQGKRTVSIDGRSIDDLTKLETNLLFYLFDRRGQVCTRDELITHLYSDEQVADIGVPDSRLDTLIGRLRQKIEPNRAKPRYVITERGVGFKLAE